MAKNKGVKARRETGSLITTPSWFGSHASMVVDHTEFGLTLADDEVLCKDDSHYYITKKNRLDSKIADPNRYSGKSVDVGK